MGDQDAGFSRHPAVVPAQLHLVVRPSALHSRPDHDPARQASELEDDRSKPAPSGTVGVVRLRLNYPEDGVPGGEGQDVGARHHVPALRVAVLAA